MLYIDLCHKKIFINFKKKTLQTKVMDMYLLKSLRRDVGSLCSNPLFSFLCFLVFISKFKLLKDVETHSSGDAGQRSAQQKLIHPHGEQHEDSDRDRDEDGEEDKQGLHLDEDGDLDITHRFGNRFQFSL